MSSQVDIRQETFELKKKVKKHSGAEMTLPLHVYQYVNHKVNSFRRPVQK